MYSMYNLFYFIATVPSFERNAICDAVNEYYPTTINESTNVHWLVFTLHYSTEHHVLYARITLRNTLGKKKGRPYMCLSPAKLLIKFSC